MKAELVQNMLQKGYIVVEADDRQALDKLRLEIFQKAKKIFDYGRDDIENFFNQFQNHGATGTKLNELRLQLIKECTNEVDSGSLIYQAFSRTLLDLIGPDLLVQKNTNLVIQQPNDPNPSELHRDSPANSPYEVVVWLPLTDSYGTKAMYVMELQETREALKSLDREGVDWSEFEKHCTSNAKTVAVPYGSALMFWPGLFHGSFINQEKETRWTLNMRYKNIFSPNGKKEPFEFFKVLQLSPLTQLAIDYQKSAAFE